MAAIAILIVLVIIWCGFNLRRLPRPGEPAFSVSPETQRRERFS